MSTNIDNGCSCNTSKKKTRICARCNTTWQEDMDYEEKVSECPQHYMSIAVCGDSRQLCTTCTNEGYAVRQTGYLEHEIYKK